MKEFSNLKISSSQLKLIVGDAVKYSFPEKEVLTKVNHVKIKILPDTIGNIINSTDRQTIKSFDSRFDNEHPLKVSINRFKTNGLNKNIIAAIRNNKACQKKVEILGKWKFLLNFISEDHRLHIEHLLEETKKSNILKFGEKYYD